jgi:hypothetical protein
MPTMTNSHTHTPSTRYRVAYTLDASSSEVEGVQGEVEEEEDEEVHDHHKQQQQLEHYKAILACRANAAVARAAGLSCRVAVWTTLLSLMPKRRRHTTGRRMHHHHVVYMKP